MLILQGGLHTCLHRLYSRSTVFFCPSLQLCWLWTAGLSGYDHALYSVQLTCFPNWGRLQFSSLFALWWLLVCACHLQWLFVHASCVSPNVLFCLPVLTPQVHVHLVSCVLFVPALLVWALGAWGLVGDWRFQVTLFLGPSIFQAPGERFLLGGSRFQGCHGYLPSGLWLLLPANLLGTSSQAHLFVMSLTEEDNTLLQALQCFHVLNCVNGRIGVI